MKSEVSSFVLGLEGTARPPPGGWRLRARKGSSLVLLAVWAGLPGECAGIAENLALQPISPPGRRGEMDRREHANNLAGDPVASMSATLQPRGHRRTPALHPVI